MKSVFIFPPIKILRNDEKKSIIKEIIYNIVSNTNKKNKKKNKHLYVIQPLYDIKINPCPTEIKSNIQYNQSGTTIISQSIRYYFKTN